MQIAQNPNLYKNAEAIMSGAYGSDSVAGSGKVSRGGRRRKGGRKGKKAKAEEAVQTEEKLTTSDLFGDDEESAAQDESAANEAYRNKLVQADLKDAHDNYFANLAKLHKGDSVQDRYVNALVNDSLSNNKLNLDSDTDINDVINRKRKLNLSDNSVSINDIIAGKGKKKLNIDTASGDSVKKDAVSGSSVLNMTDDEKLAYYADPNRKLTNDEKKDANRILDSFNKEYQQKRKNGELKNLSSEEWAKLHDEMQAYNNVAAKQNVVSSFAHGVADRLTKGTARLAGGITSAVQKLTGHADDAKATNDAIKGYANDIKATAEGASNQNPIAYDAGKMVENAAEYAALNGALEAAGVTAKAAGALENTAAIKGVANAYNKVPVLAKYLPTTASKVAEHAANLGFGTVADAALDTLPREIENVSDGMNSKEIAKDAVGNLASNMAFNAAVEALPVVAKPIINKIIKKPVAEATQNMAESAGKEIAQDTVKPVENAANNAVQDSDLDNFIKNYDPNVAKESAKDVPSPRDYYKQVVNDAVDNAVDKEAVNTLKDSVKDTRKLTEDELIPVALNLQKRYQKIRDKIPEAEKAQFEKGIEQKFYDIFAKQQKYTLDDMDSYIKGYEDKVNPLVKTKYGEFRQSDLGERFENVAQNGLDYVAKKRVNPAPIKSEITQESYAKVLSNVTQIKNGIDDVAKKVDFTDKPLAAKKFEELKASYNFLQEAVTSDDMAYVSQAKKAVESSRKSFVNAMKKAGDASYGDLGKAKFGRIIDSVDKSILDNKNAVKGALPTDADGFIKVDESDLPEHLKGTTGFDHAKGVDIPNTNQNLPKLNAPEKVAVEELPSLNKPLPLNLQMFAEKAKKYGRDIEAMADGADKEHLRKAYKEYQTAMQSAIDNSDRKAAKEAFERLEGSLSAVKERGYAKSMRTKTDLPDEVKQAFIDEPEVYKQLSNKDTKAKAESIFNSGSLEEVSTKYRDLLDKRDPSAVPLSDMINRELISQGKTDEAVQNIRELAEKMTKAGQFNQAALINLMHDDPMTALKYAQKDIDKLNKEGLAKFGKKWKDFELTQDEIKAFGDIKAGDSDAIKKMLDKVGQRIGREYPTTMTEKLLEARKISMLLNTRTLSRNFGANVPTLGMRSVADRVEAVGQHVAKLINPDFTMTQSLKGSTGKARSIANEVYTSDAVQELLKGSPGKYSSELKNGIAENKQMFKNSFLSDAVDKGLKKVFGKGSTDLNKALSGKEGITSGMETLRNLTYKALDVGDTPFVKENFISRLGSYINAQGIKSVDEVPDEAIQIAYEEAMKATYKDNSWAVGMVSGVKKAIGKIPYVGKPISDAIIPFVQAPANIGARMVDYSPIRGTKGIADIVKGAKSAD
jgi:histone H3/H4